MFWPSELAGLAVAAPALGDESSVAVGLGSVAVELEGAAAELGAEDSEPVELEVVDAVELGAEVGAELVEGVTSFATGDSSLGAANGALGSRPSSSRALLRAAAMLSRPVSNRLLLFWAAISGAAAELGTLTSFWSIQSRTPLPVFTEASPNQAPKTKNEQITSHTS